MARYQFYLNLKKINLLSTNSREQKKKVHFFCVGQDCMDVNFFLIILSEVSFFALVTHLRFTKVVCINLSDVLLLQQIFVHIYHNQVLFN